jgi:Mrp family chromosome partitioning ATPase
MERGEGKSFCSLNIATSLALVKKKVVLVNLDLRAEQLFFPNMENCLGAGAFLDDLIPLPEIITATDIPFLDYIPAGHCPQHAAELFRDEKIEDMIAYLKEKYDYIIIDCSPVGKIADSMVLARFADFGFYITRANYSRKSDLTLLNHFYEEGRLGMAGFIWNGQRLNRKDRNNFYYRKQKPQSKKRVLPPRKLS